MARGIAAWSVIRASCPAPTIPTVAPRINPSRWVAAYQAAGGTGYQPSGRRRPGCSIVCRRHATCPHVVGTAATGLAPNDSGWQLRR